jgi:NADPH-dependent curcumin reductase CurA
MEIWPLTTPVLSPVSSRRSRTNVARVSTSTREIHLAARPHGEPVPSDFKIVETELPDPVEGQVIVRNVAMSVDPYMRPRMNDVPSYVPPFGLDEALDGGAVGEVIASAVDSLPVGTLVTHGFGWREHALVHRKQAQVVVPDGVPASYFLGVLGMPALTAYAGLFTVADFKEGDTVFVSGAAGAVGSLVGQFARLRGAARVVGSAGSPAKIAHLVDDLGFDAAFDYHDGSVRSSLRTAAPGGIDVYFDNVGGDHLEAAIDSLKLHGRVALCGAISSYNATSRPTGPANLASAIGKRLTLRGFIVIDYYNQLEAMRHEVGGWLRSGQLVYRETVVDGLDHAVDAFLGVLRGENTGKMIVAL